MKFQQTLGSDEESVDLQLTSKCKFEVVCSMQWEVSCSASDEAQSASVDESKRSSTLEFSDTWQVNASAARCESDWEVRNVRWNCVPVES